VSTSTKDAEIGIVVDAGPSVGYGHAVRSLRLARALSKRNRLVVFPLSAACRAFMEGSGVETVSLPSLPPRFSDGMSFPPLVITDLREGHGITATIHRHGSHHISIHDLGLGQCHSDVAIDGSITRLFPYCADKNQKLFLGPQYMMTRDSVTRTNTGNTVLVTLGGGSTADFGENISKHLSELGLKAVTTQGFVGNAALSDAALAEVMSTCCFAISASGVTLYDLLASGVPTIAVAVDRVQLRTAAAFHEVGAVLSGGLVERLSPALLLRCCKEMLENQPLVQRITRAGQAIVDGKGLSRVVEIVRRQLWLTSQPKTFSPC
jgi:spore coat polysaccharide biosynthesis predicted glycosyltransferase SpsG